MKTYTVWFKSTGWNCIFVSGVPGLVLANRIAVALEDEGFVTEAWYEED